MAQQAPILIVSASAGTGHVRAGEALRQAFKLDGLAADHVDILDLAPGWVRTLYGGGFEVLAARAPRVWRELYDWSDGPRGDRARWGPVAGRVLFREFRRLLRSRAWPCCVCTHFLPSQVAAGRKGLPPFVQVMTDYALHRFWVQPRVQRHFVPSAEVAAQLEQRLPGAWVQASGVPVDPVFSHVGSRSEARAALGLDPDRPIALVMGGGMGVGIERAVLAALAAQVPGLQVLAVCGRNADARARLAALGVEQSRLRVLGFIDYIERAIAAADVVVTKPGGLTTSETLAVGRPLILTRPIPGHEALNLSFLVRSGAALSALETSALTKSLEHFFDQPELRLSLARGARATGSPRAAETIAGVVRRAYALSAAA